MKTGWTILGVFVLLALATIYFAAGSKPFLASLPLLAVFAIALLFLKFIELTILVCDGQLKKTRPAPALPFTMMGPDLSGCAGTILVGSLVLIPSYFINGVAPYSAGFFVVVAFGIIGAICAYLGVSGIFKKTTVAELTPEGISAKFRTMFDERDFISWSEIENIHVTCWGGSTPVVLNRVIIITLQNGEPHFLRADIHKVSFKELKAWLQEYLSRYGSSDKALSATERKA